MDTQKLNSDFLGTELLMPGRVMSPLSPEYAERVYAGVLGKLIGVYLGRPVENWSYEKIAKELGDIEYYIHEKRGRELIVTDDDISGTFTFFRALEDNGFSLDLSAEQIGNAWLNYLIEQTTILWWGGMGNSTEHTAYLRLKDGIAAPKSGSAELNGKVISEQIGAQIFIEAWGMICPGNPAMAADLAKRAASVSHDGEAIYAAQVVAALVAAAFVEPRIDVLLDTAVALIPPDCVIRQLIDDLRDWHATDGDWRANRARLEDKYGYDKFLGPVHIVPNHGLIILALLHGGGDFQKSLSIVNTCGWDTDCNSGNLGCILGVRGGLPGIDDGPDWRGPVSDRLYLPSADPGRTITDAVRESFFIINAARQVQGAERVLPKQGARFHFEMPGAMQGFRLEASPETAGVANLRNVIGHSKLGERALAVTFRKLATGRAVRLSTPTFAPPESVNWTTGYVLVASPTIYSGQDLWVALKGDADNATSITVRPYVSVFDENDQLKNLYGPESRVSPGESQELHWRVPATDGFPIGAVGIELRSRRSTEGILYIDAMSWSGTPDITLPPVAGRMWGKAWAKAIDRFAHVRDGYSMLAQNRGTGLLIQGTREWEDYSVSATLNPNMVVSFGLAARMQGLRRYYCLRISAEGKLQLVKMLDGEKVLSERKFQFSLNVPYKLRLDVHGASVKAFVDDAMVFEFTDTDRPFLDGSIGLVVEEGCVAASDIQVQPLTGSVV